MSGNYSRTSTRPSRRCVNRRNKMDIQSRKIQSHARAHQHHQHMLREAAMTQEQRDARQTAAEINRASMGTNISSLVEFEAGVETTDDTDETEHKNEYHERLYNSYDFDDAFIDDSEL